MIVRLLKPWKARRVGTILADCPDGAANMLIKRGIAETIRHVAMQSEPQPEVKRERKRERVAS